MCRCVITLARGVRAARLSLNPGGFGLEETFKYIDGTAQREPANHVCCVLAVVVSHGLSSAFFEQCGDEMQTLTLISFLGATALVAVMTYLIVRP